MGEDIAVNESRKRRAIPVRLPLTGEHDSRQVEADLRTGEALDGLDPNLWTVISDLQWPGGRYGHVDHVVVGRSGVYVIDTKTWSNDVTVFGDHLRYEGHTQDSVVTSLTEAAAAVALLIPGVPQRLVKPVLVVDGGSGQESHIKSVLICSNDTLVSVLQGRVHGMSSHQVTLASEQLRDHLHNRGLVKLAARAGHHEVKKQRKPFTPMRGVPVIRIAIAVWFAATLVLAPHTFTDTYANIHDTVQETIDNAER